MLDTNPVFMQQRLDAVRAIDITPCAGLIIERRLEELHVPLIMMSSNDPAPGWNYTKSAVQVWESS